MTRPHKGGEAVPIRVQPNELLAGVDQDVTIVVHLEDDIGVGYKGTYTVRSLGANLLRETLPAIDHEGPSCSFSMVLQTGPTPGQMTFDVCNSKQQCRGAVATLTILPSKK